MAETRSIYYGLRSLNFSGRGSALMLVLLFVALLTTGKVKAKEIDLSTKGQAPIKLFNGSNLDGFYTFLRNSGKDNDPCGVFTVQDGLLRISGQEWGCVTTENEYRNYHLVAEFKWGSITYPPREHKARDCGILVHSVGTHGAFHGLWLFSIECQIIEGGTGDFIVVGDKSKAYAITCPVRPEKSGGRYVYQPCGKMVTIHSGRINWFGRDPNWRDIKDFRGKDDIEKPVGQWNRYECIADGDYIKVILNGVTVNESFNTRPSKGRIQIQSEGAEIFFRRVELLPLKGKKATGTSKPPRRLIYNSDANNMFIYDDAPMSPAGLNKYVDEVADAGATTFFMSPNFGMTMNFPTKIGDMIGEYASSTLAAKITLDAKAKTSERAIVNIRSLIEAGHDPMNLIVERSRARGMETFISFRPNEVHAVEQDDHLIFSRFWKNHPQWRIGKAGDPLPQIYLDILGPNTSPIVASWLPGGLNFAVPQVREHRLAQLRECCERYNIDGLDLDFQRFPMYFKPGTEKQNIETMTSWVREVRAMTKEVGRKRGRPLQLCARVMARPEQNLAIGLDPVTWVNEDLLDFIVVSHYLRNDFPLPIKQYRKAIPKNYPLYASIEVARDRESYRRIARQLWQDGVDGILVFNFFTSRHRGVEPPFDVLAEIGDPVKLLGSSEEKASGKEPGKPLLLICNKHEDTMSFVDAQTYKPLAKIDTGPNPHEIVLSKDRRYAYLSNYRPPGNTISVIDIVKRKHILQIPTSKYNRIHGAAISPDGKYVYFTAGQTGFVVEIDTATNKMIRAIPTHGKISHMVLVSEDGKYLYTANISTENVSVIDRKSGTLVTQIPCGKGAEGMAFTPDNKHLWVGNQTAGSITIIDVPTNKAVKTFPCPGMPVRIRFTPDGKRALVSSWAEKGELIVIDVATLKEIKRLPVGSRAIGLEISPDGKRVFVGCEHTDGVHVVDLESLTVVEKIFTGDGSDSIAWWAP